MKHFLLIHLHRYVLMFPTCHIHRPRQTRSHNRPSAGAQQRRGVQQWHACNRHARGERAGRGRKGRQMVNGAVRFRFDAMIRFQSDARGHSRFISSSPAATMWGGSSAGSEAVACGEVSARGGTSRSSSSSSSLSSSFALSLAGAYETHVVSARTA